ncbi:MAG: dihydropteroate synthase [Saprospiraceae bacterium]|nr:dihydropteroate synthase [Saprospiraceae bacterium]
MNSIRVGEKLISLDNPIVMGILNVTTDSFFDGGYYNNLDKAISQIERMHAQGASIIDVGGFSSNPNSKLIPVEEEISRIEPIIKEVYKRFPDIVLSIDTFSSEVVRRMSQYGSFIVNDISGFAYDAELIPTVVELGLPYILMHMKGRPDTMVNLAQYDDVVMEVYSSLNNKVLELKSSGVEQIIVDPGFGFAKHIRHNFEILNKLEVFTSLDHPLLVGISRKSMIYKTLNVSPQEALNGTTALHMISLLKGAKILRVHDVTEACETIKLWHAYSNNVND